MPRYRYDKQLATLHRELTQMGSLCEEIIAVAADALAAGDGEMARRAEPLEEEIDRMERTIEALCLQLLLQQQPVAGDLRQISAALKMITDMERVGDQACDIAEIIPHLAGYAHNGQCEDIRAMADATRRMVNESIDAFVRQDLSVAQAAIRHDDLVDEGFLKTKSSLIRAIAQHPEEGEYALDLLMIAKYFERIGDHAVNIAQWVVFSVTGTHDPQPD